MNVLGSRASERLMRLALVLAVLLVALPATAGEIQIGTGIAVRKSTWRGDWAGGGQLGLGYRFARVFAIDALGWEEVATVDRRLNTGLTLGLTGTLPFETIRPSLRLYFIHQHEEGWVSVAEHPFGVIAGIGPGIRHRAGFGTRLGVEVPFSKKRHVEWVANTALDMTFFPDASLGASAYFGLMGGIGLNYSLEELP